MAAGLLTVYGQVFVVYHDKFVEPRGMDDFLAFYAGARMVGTANLYDPAACRDMQIRTTGNTGPNMLYVRWPWVALLLWPLGQLKYWTAHALWYVARILAVVGFVFLWPHNRRPVTAAVCCWSFPLAVAIANAQDVPFVLLGIGLWQRLEHMHRPFWAGLALSLCVAKFNLILLLPVLLMVHGRRRVMAGCAAGGLLLGALSFAAAPWDWPARYFHVLLNPALDTGQSHMPNIHGLGLSLGWELALCLAVALAVAVAARRAGYLESLALVLMGSLLVSHHAYIADGLILIPAILILSDQVRRPVLRWASLALASPLPWLLLLRG